MKYKVIHIDYGIWQISDGKDFIGDDYFSYRDAKFSCDKLNSFMPKLNLDETDEAFNSYIGIISKENEATKKLFIKQRRKENGNN